MTHPDHGYRTTRLLDRGAIGLSGLCLIHCLAFPVLIAFLPALASVLPQQWWVHSLILATAIPLAGLALWRGWRRHGDARPALLGGLGLGLMTLGVLVRETTVAETVLTVAGGLTVAAAHVLNWRLDPQAGHRHARLDDGEREA